MFMLDAILTTPLISKASYLPVRRNMITAHEIDKTEI